MTTETIFFCPHIEESLFATFENKEWRELGRLLKTLII